MNEMDEFSLINAIKQHTYQQSNLKRGIGDDAAVFQERMQDVVLAVDTFVEGVHFTRKTMSATQIGYRALAANLSDLAAMGATPFFYLVSIVVPPNFKSEEVIDLFKGMRILAKGYRADLIGGDTVSGTELVLSVTVVGKVKDGKARYRHEAKPGDNVFVTGTLGDSQAGRYLLEKDIDINDRAYFIKRHRLPTPRVNFAKELKDIKRMALNDISDGIGNEAHEIAEASNVSILLEDEKIPVHEAFNVFSQKMQDQWKYFGGEDFELVGTVPSEDWIVIEQVGKHLNLPVTKIGKVISKQQDSPVFIKKKGLIKPLKKDGYTHLKKGE